MPALPRLQKCVLRRSQLFRHGSSKPNDTFSRISDMLCLLYASTTFLMPISNPWYPRSEAMNSVQLKMHGSYPEFESHATKTTEEAAVADAAPVRDSLNAIPPRYGPSNKNRPSSPNRTSSQPRKQAYIIDEDTRDYPGVSSLTIPSRHLPSKQAHQTFSVDSSAQTTCARAQDSSPMLQNDGSEAGTNASAIGTANESNGKGSLGVLQWVLRLCQN